MFLHRPLKNTFLFLCLGVCLVCVFLCMYAWICVGYVHSHMHIHVKGRGQHWLIFSVALLYVLWERIPQWKHSFETRTLWLASKLQGLSYFSLPGTDVTGVYRSIHILSSICGFQPWTPCLFSCRSSNWDIYPSLRTFSFKVTIFSLGKQAVTANILTLTP